MSNEKASVMIVPSTDTRHVRGKNSGKDWYVQRAGLQSPDGLAEPFEIWHAKQDRALKAGQYTVQSGGAYVQDGRLVVRPEFVPVGQAK